MSRAHKVSATICVDRPQSEDELEIKVTGTATPFVRGRFSGPPELCYPDEGGDIVDVSATLNDKEFELTDAEEEKAIEALYEAAADAAESDEEYSADAQAEALAEARAERGFDYPDYTDDYH